MTTAAARSAPELLSEIASWFSRDPLVAPEYQVAAAEFFGGTAHPWYAPDEREAQQAHGRCSEWFAYHRPSEVLGRTPFEHLLATLALSGRGADRDSMIRFRGQIYDFFEVVKSGDKELVVRALRSDREYRVGSNPVLGGWVRKGFHVLTRIFPWGEAFVASPVITQFSSRDRWVARFRQSHEGLDPQEVERGLFLDRRHPNRVLMPQDQIEADIGDFYGTFGIKESAADAFRILEGFDSPVDYLIRHLPKVARKPHVALYDLNDLGTLLMALWHHTPRPDLEGRTAFDLQQADPARYQTEILPRLTWKQA